MLIDVRSLPCESDRERSGPKWRITETAVRVGGLVYGINYVPYLNGHEVTRKQFPLLDLPHRIRHILETSADSCRTWGLVPTTP
jgi:hypothetical protein